ncbi:MAG: hypothetical protein ABI647_00330 [Gemmatimonadota bacterium]
MAGTIQIVGVYPVDTVEPIHLVEVLVSDAFDDVDWGSFRQDDPDIASNPEGEDAVDTDSLPHDEQPVEQLPDGRTRVVFFVHQLDVSRPLLSPFGALQLPGPTPRPGRLAAINYGPPF